jgi:hypothetical protein
MAIIWRMILAFFSFQIQRLRQRWFALSGVNKAVRLSFPEIFMLVLMLMLVNYLKWLHRALSFHTADWKLLENARWYAQIYWFVSTIFLWLPSENTRLYLCGYNYDVSTMNYYLYYNVLLIIKGRRKLAKWRSQAISTIWCKSKYFTSLQLFMFLSPDPKLIFRPIDDHQPKSYRVRLRDLVLGGRCCSLAHSTSALSWPD